MANKLKSPPPEVVVEKIEKADKPKKVISEKPKIKSDKQKNSPDKLKADREEKLDFKKIAKDERTHKIIGTISLLLSVFLFIAFISYFFTWKEDQDKVLNNGADFLFDNETKVSNLLGRLGAYISHFFIYKGFGAASLLVCTFFFVLGINKLVGR